MQAAPTRTLAAYDCQWSVSGEVASPRFTRHGQKLTHDGEVMAGVRYADRLRRLPAVPALGEQCDGGGLVNLCWSSRYMCNKSLFEVTGPSPALAAACAVRRCLARVSASGPRCGGALLLCRGLSGDGGRACSCALRARASPVGWSSRPPAPRLTAAWQLSPASTLGF